MSLWLCWTALYKSALVVGDEILACVNETLIDKRRSDLESVDVEYLELENQICPHKSQSPLLF